MRVPVILIVSLLALAFPAESSITYLKTKQVSTPATEFVQLTQSGFVYHQKPFFPVVLNYMTAVMFDDKQMWPAVHPAYQRGNRFRFLNPNQCYRELVDQMILIRDMGFNTVRIVNIGEAHIVNKRSQSIGFKAGKVSTGGEEMILIKSDEDYVRYFAALRQLMKAVNEAGLKCIFTVRLIPESKATEKHFRKLAEAFRNESAIFAYDFFNEPLYADSPERTKYEVYKITKRWHKIRKKFAPMQLSTIGLASRSELFEWDPEVVQCDFISFHPYNKETDEFLNELCWYNQFLDKPWIIGETAVPSDNDSVPYKVQVDYAELALRQTVSCGGKGFSWWQYSETDWNKSFDNHLGILTKTGNTKNSKGNTVFGTQKPVVEVFKQFTVNKFKGQCECTSNYYNSTGATNYRITGRIVNENGQPLKSGAIIGWGKGWSNSLFTPVKPDGTFTLYGNVQFYHWMVSALQYERIMRDCDFNEAIMIEGTPTINLGTIQLEKVF